MNKRDYLCCFVFCLFFLQGVQAAELRNPFQPPVRDKTDCLHTLSPAQWRLMGIINGEGGYIAWVISPQGQWQRLIMHQWMLGNYWQVTYISQVKLEICKQREIECLAQEQRCVLLTLRSQS